MEHKAKRAAYISAEPPDPSSYDGRYEAELNKPRYEEQHKLQPLQRYQSTFQNAGLFCSKPTLPRRRAQLLNLKKEETKSERQHDCNPFKKFFVRFRPAEATKLYWSL